MVVGFETDEEARNAMIGHVESIHKQLPEGCECILIVFKLQKGADDGGISTAATVDPRSIPVILESLAQVLRIKHGVENN